MQQKHMIIAGNRDGHNTITSTLDDAEKIALT